MWVNKSLRLKGYDYSKPGLYFITIKTKKDIPDLGNISDQKFILNELGLIIKVGMSWLNDHEERINIISHNILKDHIHFIVRVNDKIHKPIGRYVGAFKTITTIDITRQIGKKTKIWQRNFYDRIIRSDTEFKNIYRYIKFNHVKHYNCDFK